MRLGGEVLATPVGLRFADSLTFDGWQRAGSQISRAVNSSAWWLGDWMLVGQDHFTNRYQRVTEAVGLDYQTVRNYAWVARKFRLSRRRDTLSFQHHAEVASLPSGEQDYWLDRAEQLGWSRNRLRQEVKGRRNGVNGRTAQANPLSQVTVTNERISRWRAAAEQLNMTLAKWIVANLDSAAEMVQTDPEAPVESPQDGGTPPTPLPQTSAAKRTKSPQGMISCRTSTHFEPSIRKPAVI